jgi:hypothetical protein
MFISSTGGIMRSFALIVIATNSDRIAERFYLCRVDRNVSSMKGVDYQC